MSYQVLARRWRPRKFSEVVGQQHVLRPLIHALDHDRLHHAFLFTGTRGVGKTTLARILARSLNCEEGVSSQPCGQCGSCQEIDEGRFADLIEVDAASKTKIDDTRDLLDNVQFAPTRGRYKVYLIDEVHMLSRHSFNALLKTLEEPPEHVKFLLATTDPEKLPVTILSRCLQFNLQRIDRDSIASYLEGLLQQDSMTYEQGALQEIARAADGSMRDALSLLDQGIAYCNEDIKISAIQQMLGTIGRGKVVDLIEALHAHNGSELLEHIGAMAQSGAGFTRVLDDLNHALQQIALYQAVPNLDLHRFGESDRLQRLAKQIDPEDIQLFYQIGITGIRDLALAPDERTGFEMILVRMLAFRPTPSLNQQSVVALTDAEKKKSL